MTNKLEFIEDNGIVTVEVKF